MVLVLGSIKVMPENMDLALSLSHEHVLRSRTEPGCISHAVHRDTEDEHRLVFVEQWRDRTALQNHFQVPESRQFVAQIASWGSEAPSMKIFLAEEVAVP